MITAESMGLELVYSKENAVLPSCDGFDLHLKKRETAFDV